MAKYSKTTSEKKEGMKEENCGINTCIMEERLTKAVEDVKNSIRWTLGICVTVLIGLVIWTATLRADQVTTQTQVMKINDDYAPLIVIQDIFENNDKMVEIFQIISNNVKPDERYNEAIRSRDKFQRDALMKISAAKRSTPIKNSTK